MIGQEYLQSIPWSQKTVASGKADQVPEALKGLLSPDEKLRERSYWRLDNEIVLQSDLYDAAYFAVPFLIQCLQESVPYGRDRIYDLLTEIALGFAPAAMECLTREGDSVPLQDACGRELLKGFRVILRDTADHDSRIAAKARELVQVLAARSVHPGNSDAEELDFHLIDLAQKLIDLIEYKVRQTGDNPEQISVCPSGTGTIVAGWKDRAYENEMSINRDGSISFQHRDRRTGAIEARDFLSADEFQEQLLAA